VEAASNRNLVVPMSRRAFCWSPTSTRPEPDVMIAAEAGPHRHGRRQGLRAIPSDACMVRVPGGTRPAFGSETIFFASSGEATKPRSASGQDGNRTSSHRGNSGDYDGVVWLEQVRSKRQKRTSRLENRRASVSGFPSTNRRTIAPSPQLLEWPGISSMTSRRTEFLPCWRSPGRPSSIDAADDDVRGGPDRREIWDYALDHRVMAERIRTAEILTSITFRASPKPRGAGLRANVQYFDEPAVRDGRKPRLAGGQEYAEDAQGARPARRRHMHDRIRAWL